MTEKNYRSGGQYGFARRPAADVVNASETLQLVYDREWDKDWDEDAESQPSDRNQKPEIELASVVPNSEHANWVVYPKRLRSVGKGTEAEGLTAEDTPLPAFVESFLQEPDHVAEDHVAEDREKPNLWLAFVLVGLIYAIGVAGIWSITAKFEASNSLSLAPANAPAKDRETLPPLDDAIDLRDALLYGPSIPEFRPEVYAYQPAED